MHVICRVSHHVKDLNKGFLYSRLKRLFYKKYRNGIIDIMTIYLNTYLFIDILNKNFNKKEE